MGVGMSDVCERCNRPLPRTGDEIARAQAREFWEYEVTGVLGPKLSAAALIKEEPQ